MKGLLIKDLYNIRQLTKIYAGIIILWMVLALVNKNSSFFGGVMMILTVLIPLSSIAYDEKAKWDRFALTMPVSKSSLVLSKYMLMLIIAAVSSLFSVLIVAVIDGLNSQSLFMCLVFLSLGVIFASVVLPLVFKFGVEKARILMMIIVIIPTAAALIISKLELPAIDDSLVQSALYFAPLAAAVLWFISLLISEAIYKKKEF